MNNQDIQQNQGRVNIMPSTYKRSYQDTMTAKQIAQKLEDKDLLTLDNSVTYGYVLTF